MSSVAFPWIRHCRWSRPGKVYKLKKVTRSVTAGGKVKLKLKLPKKGRKAAKNALEDGRKVKAKLKVVAQDPSGNKTTKRRTVKLKLG